MAWYNIVLLFMFAGSCCVFIGVLTGLMAKRYKAMIRREEQLTDMLEVLCWNLAKSRVMVSSDPENVFVDRR